MFTFFEKADAKYEKLFFDHSIKNINNETIDLNQYKGKTILLVNVASKCGFTKQYTGLQDLYEKYKDRGFYVIGVPSNQFGGQESGTNEEINVVMHIEEWFKNPNTWDLNLYNQMLMPNSTAQILMSENGQNVFTLESIN